MKCDICNEEHKSFVAYKISKTNFGVVCHKCFEKIKRKEAVK